MAKEVFKKSESDTTFLAIKDVLGAFGEESDVFMVKDQAITPKPLNTSRSKYGCVVFELI